MARVQNKVALVTGGALGLGRAAALMLAREGASVVVTDVRVADGEAVVEEIRRCGGNAIFVSHDVASETDWNRVLDETQKAFGRLDILVNNAGIAFVGSVESTTLDEWRRVQSVNLDGVFLGTKLGIERMRRNAHPAGGSIINLSSIEGLIGDPDLAAYNASKGGVRIFTKSAALHCARARYNIRVNSIHPAYIRTPMVEGIASDSGNANEKLSALEKLHPIGRLGQPDEIAYGVIYLASDESAFTTGTELVIDGGYTAQ